MVTFVINLHAGIPNMALAEPFLYPLEKEGKLQLIFQAADNLNDRIEMAAVRVRRHLERSAYTKWQAVFLVKTGGEQRHAYRDSLSGQMLLIRRLFLENTSINTKPDNAYIIAIDQVNEDEAIPAIQASDVYRDSWELDTSGFVRNAQRFFVSESQLQQLDQIWRNKVKIDGNTIVNLGFQRLPFELQEAVNEAVKDIAAHSTQFLDPQRIDFSQYAVSRNINYIDEQAVRQMHQTFTERLGALKNDPSRYVNFSPAELLRTCIAEKLGIFSPENETTYRILRFPMRYTHEDIFQQYLLRLSVVLAMIANQEDAIRQLARKNYTVSVELDDRELQQITYNYLEHLHNTEQRFANRLNVPLSVSLPQLENKDCSCTSTLERSVPPPIEIGFLRSNGDLQEWDNWNNNIAKHLEEYALQSRRKIETCIQENRQKQSQVVVRDINNLDEHHSNLERSKNALQGTVEHSFIANNGLVFDWRNYQREKEETLKPKLFSRPSKNEIIWLMVALTLVMTLPFWNTYIYDIEISYQLFYYAAIAVLMLTMSLLTFWLSKRFYHRSFMKLLLAVQDKARELRLNIYDDFERRKDYIKSLCQLNIVRYNYEQANAARTQRTETNVSYDFHRRKLAEHKDIARKIMRIFNANEQSMTSTMRLDENMTDPKPDLPVYENAVYTPTTFMSAKMPTEGIENVRIENVPIAMKHALAKLATKIVFDRDKIYSKGNKA
jgi:hypothetical protein